MPLTVNVIAPSGLFSGPTFTLGVALGWAGLGWAGLGWAGLGWDRIGSDRIGQAVRPRAARPMAQLITAPIRSQ